MKKASVTKEAERKKRFSFTVDRDIFLLKTLIQVNPWMYGEHQWEDAVKAFSTRSWDVTERTLKCRIETLRKQYKSEAVSKTGTEEERTERAKLIEEVEKLIDEGKAQDEPIIIARGAGYESDNFNKENEGVSASVTAETDGITCKPSKSQALAEKKQADSNRDSSLKAYLDDNKADDPSPVRRKRARLSEEDMIMKRQEHEMLMEQRKLDLEEERERRLQEEGKRRDELQKLQLEMQQQHLEQQKLMMECFSKLIQK